MDGTTFVDADGKLAESWCDVELINLTPWRARQLRRIHWRHLPRRCAVLHATAELLAGAE